MRNCAILRKKLKKLTYPECGRTPRRAAMAVNDDSKTMQKTCFMSAKFVATVIVFTNGCKRTHTV